MITVGSVLRENWPVKKSVGSSFVSLLFYGDFARDCGCRYKIPSTQTFSIFPNFVSSLPI